VHGADLSWYHKSEGEVIQGGAYGSANPGNFPEIAFFGRFFLLRGAILPYIL
jgi:hypothetical protein